MKMQDPSSFTIPTSLGTLNWGRLCVFRSKHQLDAIINGEETKFRGSYSNNYYFANGRYTNGVVFKNFGRCTYQGRKIYFSNGFCGDEH